MTLLRRTELRKKHGKTFKVSVTKEDGTVLEQFVVAYSCTPGTDVEFTSQVLFP
ncbi:MAG TPA: hypothetical protein VFD98_08830 [Terracidiphilus sp.]|jgi:hypothetical protein|nr:hypothetical protein [Terracidiphilus sp.]